MEIVYFQSRPLICYVYMFLHKGIQVLVNNADNAYINYEDENIHLEREGFVLRNTIAEHIYPF